MKVNDKFTAPPYEQLSTHLERCTCPTVWQGVLPPSCPEHNPPPAGMTTRTTSTFEMYEDNPERQRQVTGGVKDNASKPRMDLIPAKPLFGVGRVLAFGARKYKPNNWRLGLRYSDTFASAQRHLLAFMDGEDLDPETGLPHVDQALCQIMFLSEYFHSETGIDDRWSSMSEEQRDAAKA